MPMPYSLVSIIITVILVGYIAGYAYNPQEIDIINAFQKDTVNSLNNATSTSNPIYAVVGIGSAAISTFLIAYTSVDTFIGVYITELPTDYYIISVILTLSLLFAVIRYIRGMWDR